MMKEIIEVRFANNGRRIGTLKVDSKKPGESKFSYADSWLASPEAFAISPDLPLQSGWLLSNKTLKSSPFPWAIADTEPINWGRIIIRRAYRKAEYKLDRPLSDLDYLLGVDDFSRVGCLQLVRTEASSPPNKTELRRPPTLLDLKAIYSSSKRVEESEETTEDLLYLEGKGTSLGGSRPKCSFLDLQNRLCIGKFPSVTDQRSIAKGEVLALTLAAQCGILASESCVHSIDGNDVSLILRFDRDQTSGRRIPYWSMATFLQKSSAVYPPASYLELAESLNLMSMNVATDASEEIIRRIFFNVLVNNVDDHANNTALLYKEPNGWELSPAFDINPVPLVRADSPYVSKTFLDDSGPVESVRQVWESLEHFGLSKAQGYDILAKVVGALSRWQTVAKTKSIGMSQKDIHDYRLAFEHHQLEDAKKILSSYR